MKDKKVYTGETCYCYDSTNVYYYDFIFLIKQAIVILDIYSVQEMDKIKFLFKEKLHSIKIIKKILHRIRSNTFEGG